MYSCECCETDVDTIHHVETYTDAGVIELCEYCESNLPEVLRDMGIYDVWGD